MKETVWLALIAGAAGILSGLITGVLSSRYEARKFREERFSAREQGYEKAQGGYRACYRKFLVNVAACHGAGYGIPLKEQEKVDVDTLRVNFLEASFTGDPAVTRELEAYWPPDQRAESKLPGKSPPNSLLEAMRRHGMRPLRVHAEEQEAFLVRGAGGAEVGTQAVSRD
jgi:hypothetical protein